MHIPYLSLSKRFLLSQLILLVVELVLFEIQYIRDGRPPIPIFEHKLVAEAHCTIVERSHLMFLLHKFRSCLIKQMILVTIQKGCSNFRCVSNSENGTNTALETVSPFVTSVSLGERVLTRFTVA